MEKKIPLRSGLTDPALALLRERAANPEVKTQYGLPDADTRSLSRRVTDPLNRGLIAASLGAPVDLTNVALNLLRAGYGTAGHAMGLLKAEDMPNLDEKPFGGSEHIGDIMNKYGIVSEHRDPMLEMAAGLLPLAPKGLSMAVNATRPGRNVVRMVKGTDPVAAALDELSRKVSNNERAVKVSKRGWVGPIAEGDATSVADIRNPGIFKAEELVHTHPMNADATFNPLSSGDRSSIPVSAVHTEPNGRLTAYRERLGSGQPPTFDDYVRQEDYVNALMKDPTYSTNVDPAQYKAGWLDPRDVSAYSGENLGAQVASEVSPVDRLWLDSLRGGASEGDLQALWPKKGAIMVHNEAPRGNAWRMAELSDFREGGPELYRFNNGWDRVNLSDVEPEYYDFLGGSAKPQAKAKYYHAGADFNDDFNPGSFFTSDKSAAETFKNNFGHPKLHQVELNPTNTATDEHINRIAKELGIYEPDTPAAMYLEQGENSPFGAEVGTNIVNRLRKMGFDSASVDDGMSANPTMVALDPRIVTRSQDGLQVVKPKGGNWIKMQEYVGDPVMTRMDKVISEMSQQPDEVSAWGAKQLSRYMHNELGTPEDPLRLLADKGISHIPDTNQAWMNNHNGWLTDNKELAIAREYAGFPAENMAQTPKGIAWENAADKNFIVGKAEQYLGTAKGAHNPWLSKVDPNTTVYDSHYNDFEFPHLIDELRNSINPNSGLPPELLMKYSSLDRLSVPQAVERVHKINEWRAQQAIEANQALANNAATVLHKEYPDVGMKWVQLKAGDLSQDPPRLSGKPRPAYDALRDALKYEGDTMGHCVGGYCDQVADGRTNIFSLRDEKGRPHVTIETRPGVNIKRTVEETTDFDDRDIWNSVYDALPANRRAKFDSYMNEAIFENGDYDTAYDAIQAHPQYSKFLPRSEEVPHDIIQIKGKGNAKPADKYLPMVQDFIRSQKWGKVGDFHNTGLLTGDSMLNDYKQSTNILNKVWDKLPNNGLLRNQDLAPFLKGKYYSSEQEAADDVLSQLIQRQQ